MDDDLNGTGETVGLRLRAAREAKGLSLDDVATQTRIPVRHLAALEESEWTTLPAPAYCVGFAKNYANVVGLDRVAIGNELREEMGGTRQVYPQAEVFEPVDPKRTMPTWLILGAIAAIVIVLVGLNFWRNRQLEPSAAPAETAATAPAAAAPAAPAAAPAALATGPVVLTALDDAWIKVREESGSTIRLGLLKKGEQFEIPASATAPQLDTGRPEALKITVGGRDVPSVGPAGHSVSHVSLRPADLVGGAVAGAPASGPGAPSPANGTTGQ